MAPKLTDIGIKLKEKGYSSNTKEYAREFMRAKRYNIRMKEIREKRTPENFSEEDLEYIKSIAIN